MSLLTHVHVCWLFLCCLVGFLHVKFMQGVGGAQVNRFAFLNNSLISAPSLHSLPPLDLCLLSLYSSITSTLSLYF